MEELSRLGSQGRLPDLPHRCRAAAELISIRQDPPTGRANRFPQLFELRSVMLYPPQKGRVSHAAAPFSQLGHPVSKTQLKAQIPTNTQDHDFLVEVPTFEPFLDWYESRHLSITPELLVRLHQSPILHALFNDGQSGDAGVSEQVVLVGREFSRLTG